MAKAKKTSPKMSENFFIQINGYCGKATSM
jgi:hypothetical protein